MLTHGRFILNTTYNDESQYFSIQRTHRLLFVTVVRLKALLALLCVIVYKTGQGGRSHSLQHRKVDRWKHRNKHRARGIALDGNNWCDVLAADRHSWWGAKEEEDWTVKMSHCLFLPHTHHGDGI